MAQAATLHTFATVAGHGAAKDYLVNAIAMDALPHALLFYGPAGVGKLSMAYSLVKYLNCKNDGADGCACNICRKISEEIFADILVVRPKGASNTITLNGWKPGKDDPDNLQYYRFLETRPLEGSRKVLILRHAERMNVAMANHILKIMEEPPSYLTLILLAERKTEMLPTIRSRCAGVKLNPLNHEELTAYAGTLKGKKWAPGDLDKALRLCEGRPGLLIQKIASAGAGAAKDTANALLQFQQLGFIAVFRTASDLLRIGNELKERTGQNELEGALQCLTAWFRDSLVLKTAGETGARLLANAEVAGELQQFGSKVSVQGHLLAIDSSKKYAEFSRRQTDKNYVLESLLMEIGKAMRS